MLFPTTTLETAYGEINIDSPRNLQTANVIKAFEQVDGDYAKVVSTKSLKVETITALDTAGWKTENGELFHRENIVNAGEEKE